MEEKKTEQATLRLSPSEKNALRELARVEDRRPADMIRLLIKREAIARGLWSSGQAITFQRGTA